MTNHFNKKSNVSFVTLLVYCRLLPSLSINPTTTKSLNIKNLKSLPIIIISDGAYEAGELCQSSELSVNHFFNWLYLIELQSIIRSVESLFKKYPSELNLSVNRWLFLINSAVSIFTLHEFKTIKEIKHIIIVNCFISAVFIMAHNV